MINESIMKRELYIDVVISESEVEEIFLYQVDFAQGGSFHAKEYLYQIPVLTEESKEESNQPLTGEPAEKSHDIIEQFYEQWNTLMMEKVPTQLYATDAVSVMAYLMEPLQNRFPSFTFLSEPTTTEPIHDCISMVRVVSMSTFDEKQYLSSGLRRRMKEKFHAVIEEVKRRKPNHLFVVQKETAEYATNIDIILTDDAMNIKKGYNLRSKASEETIAVKLYELLKKYPEADIITDGINRKLYRILYNMTLFIDESFMTVNVYSLQSMMLALGKNTKDILESIRAEKHTETYDASVWAVLYQDYIKNAEELRLERFQDNKVYRIHKFFLPVRLSSAEDFRKLMNKNLFWHSVEGKNETYQIFAKEEELSAKYKIDAGDEQFILRVTGISCTRYLNNYVVICIETENHFYPGTVDCQEIDKLGSTLLTDAPFEQEMKPVHLELKMKLQGKVYTLSSTQEELWLNGLFLLGKNKRKNNEDVTVTTCSNEMFVVEEEPNHTTFDTVGIEAALIKTECYHRLEEKLAQTVMPKKSGIRPGKLNHKQKVLIQQLFEYYRYLRTSFGVEWETASDTKEVTLVSGKLQTEKLADRLADKFSLYK